MKSVRRGSRVRVKWGPDGRVVFGRVNEPKGTIASITVYDRQRSGGDRTVDMPLGQVVEVVRY